MKRFLALLLAAFMVCSAFMIPVSAARDYVISPEYSGGGSDPLPPPEEIPEEPVPEDPGTVPEEPTPEQPGVEIPEEPVPEAPAKPTSPQTGYTMGVTGLIAAAAAFGTVAVVAGKKASSR